MTSETFATCSICEQPSFSIFLTVGDVVICNRCKSERNIKGNSKIKIKEPSSKDHSKVWWYCTVHNCGSVRPQNYVRHMMKDCSIVKIVRKKSEGWLDNTFGGYNGDVGRDYWLRKRVNNIARFKDIMPHYSRFLYIKWKKEKRIKLSYWEEKSYTKAKRKYKISGAQTIDKLNCSKLVGRMNGFEFMDSEAYFDGGTGDNARDPHAFLIAALPGKLDKMTSTYKDYIMFSRIRYKMSLNENIPNVDIEFYNQNKQFLEKSKSCMNKSKVMALLKVLEDKDIPRVSPVEMYKDILKRRV